jgi:hypothetical protein
MAALDELDGSSPLQDFISQVIQTIAPKKEYRSSPTIADVSITRAQSHMDAVNEKLGRASASRINANDFFFNGPSASTSDSAWSAIYSQRSASASSVAMLSGRSPSEMADALGFDVAADWPRYQNMTLDQAHHIAFDVEDIYAEMSRLKAEGFEILNEIPKKGADQKIVVFLHPRSTNGVLVELCQADPNPEKP